MTRIDVFQREAESLGIDLPLIEFGQGYKDMSPAIDALESDLLNGRMRHGMHPVLTMCAANAVVSKDPAGNRKLDKSNGLMAWRRWRWRRGSATARNLSRPHLGKTRTSGYPPNGILEPKETA